MIDLCKLIKPKIQQKIIEPVASPSIIEEVPFIPATSNIEIQQENSNEARFFSPLVLNIAQNEGVGLNELQQIPGTGSQGRVSKKDILRKNFKKELHDSLLSWARDRL